MMAGIHHMEQDGFGDSQHLQGTYADAEEEDMSSDPETSCTSNYDMPGDMDQDLQQVYNAYDALQEMADIERPVVLNPEFLMRDDIILHPEPQLTFSSDGFKIEYSDLDSGQHGDPITLFWEVSDIISIDCKWTQTLQTTFFDKELQTTLITLHARSSAETLHSGPVKVKFAFVDPHWQWKQQKIWQLASRYQEVWKNIQSAIGFIPMHHSIIEDGGNIIFSFEGKFLSRPIHASVCNPIAKDDFASQNWSTEPSLCFSQQYFSSIGDFEDVIYPKGDRVRDAVSISSRDVKLLLPEIFVNDTIIDFYIKYLSERIEPTERRRYHFFSSFFFRKLADLDKDQENAPKGREAFLGVCKWTRKIDIFAKEFLFIPVNFSLHWSLLVICYPGEVDTFEDGDAKIAGKLPCILHMNSIKGTHSGLKDIIQSYLWEEWNERHPESASDSSDKFLNLRFVSLEVPQQDNLFDCGLFLLHFVERFLMDAPSCFNPLKISVFESFLSEDWFLPAEASLKRSLIRKLSHELVSEPSKIYPKLVCGDEKLDERHHRSENAEGEPFREFLGQGCFAAEPDSVCRILGAHQQQQSKLICLNDSEKGLSVPGRILETGGVAMVALQEMQVCSSDDDVIVCSPKRDAKNEPFLAYFGNQLDVKSCAPEDAEAFKGSCSAVKYCNSHQESLLDSLDSNQKISSQAEVEIHEHDIMDFRCCPFSDNVNEAIAGQGSRNAVEDCHREAPQDMDSVMMLDACKHDTGPGQECTKGEADNGSCDLAEDTDSVATGGISKDVAESPFERDIVENMDGRCDLSDDTGSVTIGDVNKGVARYLFESNAVEAVDPMALQDDIKAQEISTFTDKIDDSEQYVNSESKDGNTDSILTSGSTVSSGLKEGNTDNVIACESTNGTGETQADDKPDSPFTVLGTQQGSTLICSNDSEKELPVPAHILATGVSIVGIEEMLVCPPNNVVAVCLPSQDAKNESFQLDLISCAQEGAEAFKGSCSVVNDKDIHEEYLMGILDKKQKISSEAKIVVHEHDIMDSKCFSFSDDMDEIIACHEYTNEVENDRCGAPQDMDSVLMLDARKNDIGPGQESTKGEADDCRRDLSEDTYSGAMIVMKTDAAERSFERNIVEAMDDRCDLSEDIRSVRIGGVNCGVAECSSERSTVEAVDPVAVEDGIKGGKTSAIRDKINDSKQYDSSVYRDGNSGCSMTSGSTVSCGLKEGNTYSAIAGGTTDGTSETHADGEDACHNLATGEVAPCEDDITCTDAEMLHVEGTSNCSAKDGTNSEKTTSHAKRPLLGITSEDDTTCTDAEMPTVEGISTCGAKGGTTSDAQGPPLGSSSEDKSILLSDDMCSLKGVRCTEVIKGSTKEETSTISDKVNDSTQSVSSESKADGHIGNAIAGKSTQGTDGDSHELTAFPCEGGTDDVDDTCGAEDENNSMSVAEKRHFPDSVCEANIKMQVMKDCRRSESTLEDDISTKADTDSAADNMNGSEHYVSYESEDGNTNRAGSASGGERHVSSEAKNEQSCVGAKRPFPDSICEAEEMVTLGNEFWERYSERAQARFELKYKRRIFFKRRKKIFMTPPSSPESSDVPVAVSGIRFSKWWPTNP